MLAHFVGDFKYVSIGDTIRPPPALWDRRCTTRTRPTGALVYFVGGFCSLAGALPGGGVGIGPAQMRLGSIFATVSS